MGGPSPPRKSRIKEQNEELILAAALEVFSTYGFRGSTVDQIAERAGMSKPNLLYYFRRKDDIYLAVLEKTLSDWLQPLTGLDPDADPVEEIRRYITAKLELSRLRPNASRLFANEILQGAPRLGAVLKGPLKRLVDRKARIIEGWISAGRLAPVDPYHLIFMVWATTQHYADFEVQMRAILGDAAVDAPQHFETAERTLTTVFLNGLRPRRG